MLRLSTQPISVPEAIQAWAFQLKAAAQTQLLKGEHAAFTECRLAKQSPQVLICGTYLQRDMNAQLLRATIFTEGGIGGHAQYQVVSQTDPALKDNAEVIGGHDIRSKELFAFYHAAESACRRGQKAVCLTKTEQRFYDTIIAPLQKRQFVLIAFSVQSAQASAKALVSHEYLHAKYFLNARYRQQVKTAWQALSQQEQRSIRNALGKIGYNATDEQLMQNEFQAYLLMVDAKESQLAAWVLVLKPKLLRAIAAT